jgi:hypothetical protein
MLINRRAQLGVWLFFAFIVLLIAVVLLFISLHGREPVKPVQVNVSNVTLYNVSIVLSNVVGSPVSYVLSNITFDVRGGFDGSSCINVSNLYIQGYISNGSDSMGCPLVGKWIKGKEFVRGLVFPDKVEFYRRGVVANSTVLLEGFSDSYYFNSTICNISRELYPCKLSLLKKAVDYSVYFNRSLLTINISDGSIQKPQICVAWNYCVSNVILNLSSINLPVDLLKNWSYDECFNVSHDLSNTTYFPVVIHRNEFVNCSYNISVLVRDFELKPYSPIGDRTAVLI